MKFCFEKFPNYIFCAERRKEEETFDIYIFYSLINTYGVFMQTEKLFFRRANGGPDKYYCGGKF
jgi:hypothetical protein